MPRRSPRQCDLCRRPFLGPVCPCRAAEIVDELLAAASTDAAPDRAPTPDPDPHVLDEAAVLALYRRHAGRAGRTDRR